jgi:hypothetical protein
MKPSNFKFYIGIIFMFFIGNLHTIFFGSDEKYDLYLLYDHKRYLTNILYDFSTMFDFTLLTYFLAHYNKRVFMPLFILSFFAWGSYFVFYNQTGSLVLIPIYLILVVCYNRNI